MNVEQEYIKDIEKLAPCPQVALDVLAVAHEHDCSVAVLAEKIERDPSLTANMLQMANSAYFGHMKKISSVHDIIVRLGIESVRIIAITSASVGLLKSAQAAYALTSGQLWQHSYATAILASIIGRYAKVKDSPSLYTAALLHDIGKMVLNRPLQVESYNHPEVPAETPLLIKEQLLLHTDHARVGMALLEKWGLPEAVFVPVGMHHTLDQPQAQRLAAKVIHLANALVHFTSIDDGQDGEFFFDVLAYEDRKGSLPEVPHFEENMRIIIEEFVEKYQATIAVYVL
ncbi:MAG TPA: HDOD domain-containing protein [Desulfurivibrionaceae bacterium]|nr:HDOD domain-containing protein [Desulfurivibrionaceae bacterium]